MISSKMQLELNKVLHLDKEHSNLELTFVVSRNNNGCTYSARISGWVYPYDYKNPRRRFISSHSASHHSLERACEGLLSAVQNPENWSNLNVSVETWKEWLSK